MFNGANVFDVDIKTLALHDVIMVENNKSIIDGVFLHIILFIIFYWWLLLFYKFEKCLWFFSILATVGGIQLFSFLFNNLTSHFKSPNIDLLW